MNRLQYRIVFNKQRGQLMAVAETALSHVKGGGAGESSGPAARAPASAEAVPAASRGPPTLLALAAAFAMGAVITLAPDASAQVKADPNAPKGQQPTVVNSANGTVQVNIQTPGAAGVSRNTYSQFDVDKRGVILNNARTDVSTQLGGFVQGNPWLARGGARVILNEVNSSAPSQLKGYVEVAGQRAEVVIANPAGIQVDGAGFINASAAVLTTGAPRFNADGSIAGYGVQGGLIRVDGQGLDGASTDYTALLARAVEINAGIWAKDARIQTGTQVMTVDGTGVAGGESLTPTGERPRYALDSTALGGIYAQRITLVGTEAGLGVRQAGQVVGGQLTLRADGWLDNTGTVYAQEADANGAPALTVQSNAGVRNAGWLASRGSADVRAPQLVGEAGSVTAAGLAADGAIVGGGGSLALTATQSAKQAGQLLAADRLTVQAPTIDLGGAQAQAGSIALDGDTVAARDALLIAGNGIEATGTASVDLTRAQAQAGTIVATAPTLTVDGAQLSAGGTLSLKADGRLSTQAASLAGQALSVAAHDIDLRKSEWLSLGTEALSVSVLGGIVADDARIATNGTDLLLAADTLSAQRARVEHYGAGALLMRTGSLDLGTAQVLSNGLFRIDATTAVIDRAEVSASTIRWQATELSHRGARTRVASGADASVDVDGRLDNTGGVLQANSDTLSLRAAVVENSEGVLSTSGRVLRVEAGRLGNRSGVMQSAGALGAGAGQRIVAIDNTGGQIVADALSLNVQQLVNADGVVAASGRASLLAGEWDNGSGRLEAGALTLNADRLLGTGSLYARGDAAIAATRLETTGVLAAGGALFVRADQVSTTGLLAAGLRVDGTVGNAGDLSIDAAGTLRHGGTLLAGGALTATAASLALQDSASQAASVAMTARQGGMTMDRATVSTSGALVLDGAGQLSTAGARLAGAQVAIKADGWRNADGEVLQTGPTGAMTLQVAGRLDNAGGHIGANGASLGITAGSFDNTAGRVAQAGDALTLNTGRLDGARGELLARGALQMRVSGNADLSDAVTQARTMDLQAGALVHRGGKMAASEGLVAAARTIDNAAGAMQAGGAVSVSGDTVSNLDGEISGRTVALDAGALTNGGRGLITGADRLTVRANTLDNAGHLQSQGGMTLNVVDSLANSGTVQGLGDLVLNAGRLTQQSTGTIAAQGHLGVDATSIDSSGAFAAGLPGNGSAAAGGDLSLRTTGVLRQGGSLFAASTLSVSGGTLDLDGSRSKAATLAFTATRGDLSLNGAQAAAADGLSISTSEALRTTGATLSGRDVTLAAREWNNTGGVLAQTGSTGAWQATVAEGLVNAQGVISAQGRAMSLQAGRLDNANGRLVQAGGGDLVLRADRVDGASGQLLTDGRLTIQTTGAIDLNGATTQASALTLTGASLDHRNGHLLVQGDAALTITAALQNQGGQISAMGALNVGAATIGNGAGQLDGQRVTLTATTLDNGALGLIAARGDLTVSAADWINGGSAQAQGRADLTVTHTLANAGTIHAQGDAALTVGTLTQDASAIVAAQGGLTIAAGSIASAGTLAAGLKGDSTLAAAGDLRLTVGGTLQQSGHLLAAGALSATAAHLDLADSQAKTAAATLVATDGAGTIGLDRATWSVRDALSLEAAGAVDSGRATLEAGSIRLTAGSWGNLAGRWLQTDAGGAFTATVSGLLDNRQGELGMNGASTTLAADRVDNGAGRIAQAGGALDVRARQFDGAQGQVLATGALTLNASGALTLDGATTQGASVRVDAGSLSHVNGRLLSAGDAMLRVGGDLDNRGGLMQAATALDIASAGMNNTAGQLSGQTVALRADRLDNGAQGVIGAGGRLTIDAGRLTNAGTVQGGRHDADRRRPVRQQRHGLRPGPRDGAGG
ncbi:filamentous hemagglutinin N-terminal domain-containing protein [Roseateles chitinivorans]|uniref:two-partner secretion domain-containing protein n=1 Tax=Roseateles chitinivorans TaxID=2917965 RepID=UPI003D671967